MTTTTTAAPAKSRSRRTPIPEDAAAATSGSTTAVDALTDTPAGSAEPRFANPHELLLDGNIRLEPGDLVDLAATIREHGILYPVLVVREPDGLRVLDGQRRVLAAIDAGLTEVPIAFRQEHDAAAVAAQLVANEQRAGLREADRLRAIGQLALFGMKPAEISRKTRIRKEKVAAALKVAKSEQVSKLVEQQPITLEDAAALTDLERHPDLYKMAVKAAGDAGFSSRLIQAQEEAKLADRRAELVTELEAVGYTIAGDDTTTWSFEGYSGRTGQAAVISDLVRADGESLADTSGTRLDPATPGLQAIILKRWTGPSTSGPSVREITAYFIIQGYRDLGYRHRTDPTDTTDEEPTAEELAEQERYAAEQRARQDRAEQVGLANAARQEWIRRDLLRRPTKQLPADFADALALAILAEVFYGSFDNDTTARLLGLETGTAKDDEGYPLTAQSIIDDWLTDHPGCAPHALIALWAASYEDEYAVRELSVGSFEPLVYLQRLQAWGYALTPVEEQHIADRIAQDEENARRLLEDPDIEIQGLDDDEEADQ